MSEYLGDGLGGQGYLPNDNPTLTSATLTGPLLLPDGSSSAPALGFEGATPGLYNTGIYKVSDNDLGMVYDGTLAYRFDKTLFYNSTANSWGLPIEGASNINPTICPNVNALVAGIGAASSGEVDIITNSLSAINVDSSQFSTFAAGAQFAGQVQLTSENLRVVSGQGVQFGDSRCQVIGTQGATDKIEWRTDAVVRMTLDNDRLLLAVPVDYSAFAVDTDTLLFPADAITTAGTVSHQIAVDIGSTTYYLVAYTHGS